MRMQVIWVIGVSMILMAALIHLPLKIIATFGLTMIALHNLLDPIKIQFWRGPGSPVPGIGTKIFMILHQPGVVPVDGFPSPILFVLYPLIPWIGVMAAGYAFGALYQKNPAQRKRMLLGIGLIAVVLFFVIRATIIYGDPH